MTSLTQKDLDSLDALSIDQKQYLVNVILEKFPELKQDYYRAMTQNILESLVVDIKEQLDVQNN